MWFAVCLHSNIPTIHTKHYYVHCIDSIIITLIVLARVY